MDSVAVNNYEKYFEDQKYCELVKEFYDQLQRSDADESTDGLLVDGFDDEQIWGQVDFKNKELVENFKSYLDNLEKYEFEFDEGIEKDDEGESVSEKEETKGEEEEEKFVDEGVYSNDGMEGDFADDLAEDVDEDFNEEGLEEDAMEEIDEDEDEDEEIDYGADLDAEDAAELKYGDFFVQKQSSTKKNRTKKNQGDPDGADFTDEEEEFDNELASQSSSTKGADQKDLFSSDETPSAVPQSSFERKQSVLSAQIKEIESELVSQKSWQLKGETSSKDRPINSLLEESLEFDYVTKPVPIITEEVTSSLEDLIKQRIINASFDDVERKVEAVEEKKEEYIDLEERKSLSKIYEDEYLKKQGNKKEEKIKEHFEIEEMMNDLFYKLNSLSNFHFTPKPAKIELRLQSVVRSVEFESTPVAIENGDLLAPQEVFKGAKKEVGLKGQDELDKNDKKRLREEKKKEKRARVINKKAKVEVTK